MAQMQCKAQLKCPVALFNIGDSKSEPFAWCGQQATHVANGHWLHGQLYSPKNGRFKIQIQMLEKKNIYMQKN